MGEPELQPCRWCGSPAITNASLDLVQCRDIECPAGRSLYRRDKWNAVAPNPLATTLAARDERIRELEAEAEKIRDTAVSIELVKVASVDLVQDADGRDRAVLSTSWGIGLHRQHNCDEEGCGCWHVIARPPLSVESRVALLDLRSAKDDAKRERDEARTRIATLERELAEARQRDEDATDLILRQGRELDAMRPKAEAAERRAEALRVIGDVHQIGVLMGEADRAILAACPAEEPREVVEPAPATVRWRCEGCKRSVPGYRVRGGPPTEHWHWNEGDSMAMYTCGPCVPVTDTQPAGAAVGEAGS